MYIHNIYIYIYICICVYIYIYIYIYVYVCTDIGRHRHRHRHRRRRCRGPRRRADRLPCRVVFDRRLGRRGNRGFQGNCSSIACFMVVSCLAILRIEGCLNSTL